VAVEPIKSQLIGIGLLLKQQRLTVPPYQRPYAWERSQVEELFKDIYDAKRRNKGEEYFLGTVVLTTDQGGPQSIVDGQQRLVTTALLISAIRNYFHSVGDADREQMVTTDYLSTRDIRDLKHTPRLNLVLEDRDFFQKNVVEPAKLDQKPAAGASRTQKRIQAAVLIAHEFVRSITESAADPVSELIDLLDFIREKAVLVVLDVSSESNAYVIFEVLNDRGLDLTVADLLKNYVFRLSSGHALEECQAAWASMRSAITTEFEEGEIRQFIRQAWISEHGLVRHKELYGAIKSQITNQAQALQYTRSLVQSAQLYAAFRNNGSPMWAKYSEAVREALGLFETAGVTQVRPLLLAVFRKFSDAEVNKTLPMMASWTVRLLIYGSGGSGPLEDNYSARAKDVSSGIITTARQLFNAFKILPSNKEFENAFSKATVSKASIARWYLARLEITRSGNAEKVVTTDLSKANLEHVLPINPGPAWGLSEDDINKYGNRLGNQAMMDSKTNVRIGNSEFSEKRVYFAQSSIELTKEIATYSKVGNR
jgi:Protein of unknown function DUF262/Protein of unknown function (DUF1524)